jgi:hypothetical protein
MSANHDHIITGQHEIKCLQNESKVFSMVPTGISTLEPVAEGSLGTLVIHYPGPPPASDTGPAVTYKIFRLGHVIYLWVSGWAEFTRTAADAARCTMYLSGSIPAAYRPTGTVVTSVILERTEGILPTPPHGLTTVAHAILEGGLVGAVRFKELVQTHGTSAYEDDFDFPTTGKVALAPFVISYVL